MKTIPTAEEFFEQWCKNKGYVLIDETDIEECMIKFAQLHVEAALKAANKKAKIINDYSYSGNTGSEYPPDQIVDEKSILNAYPKENIK